MAENAKDKILLVDDEPFNLGIYSEIFSDLGYEVFTASNSHETFEILKKNEPDLLLLDIILHNELGLDILKKIKTDNQHPYMYIVMITGAFTSSQQQAAALEQGADGYIVRPIDDRELIARVEAFMRHKRTLDSLRKSESRLRKIIARNPDAILVVDTDGKISFANPSAEDMFKLTIDELLSRVFGYPVIQGEHTEINIVRQDEEERVGEMRTIDIDWNDKETFLISIRDITHHKQIEEELKKALVKSKESDKLKSAFLANMSHEIRTPMNGVLGFTRFLKKPNLPVEKQQKYISIIEQSGLRMLNLINDIIDISKIESGNMEVNYSNINIHEMFASLFNFFEPQAKKKKNELLYVTSLPDNKAYVFSDNEKITAIFTNLIKNAVKYTTNGKIEFGYELKENEFEFYVKDTGIGIPQDRLDAIFERFVQADLKIVQPYEGAGLGLSISKAYVEILKGEIRVESQENKGSNFYFTIPVKGKKVVDKVVAREKKIDSIEKLSEITVLVADDDETANIYLEEILEGKCKKVLHARNGKQAVDMVHKEKDINLILMDIKMPVMDGYTATRMIKQYNQDVIIIAQTAYAMSGDKEKAFKAGCNGYITKPINQNELLLIMSQLL